MKKLIKNICFIAMSVLFLHISVAQNPSWTFYESRKQLYPDDKYLTGFSSQVVRENDNLQEVQQMLMGSSRTKLIESINISIKSEATTNIENRNTKTLEIFKQASTSTSQADLIGLKTMSYYDPKTKEAYAFAYVKISELLEATRSALTAESTQLSKKIEIAQQYALANDRENAMKTYYACFSLLRQMEARIALLLTLGNESDMEQYSDFESKVNRGISELKTAAHATLEEVCFFIVDGIKQQLPEQYGGYGILPAGFTYMDSRMGSDFSVRLSATLQSRLSKEGLIIQQPGITTGTNKDHLSISGTYWPDGKNLKIIVNLADPSSGRTIASLEDFLPMTWLTDRNIKYLPDNLESAIALEKQLSRDEITDVGLLLKLWTNKGNSNPIYKKDEKMQIYVQVSQPCFIRLIYYFADGTKVLLQDSWFIDQDKINKPYILPTTFQCYAPFGAEILQLVAQTEQFRPLQTKSEDGYDFIIDSDQEIIATTRGMKKEKPALLMAEKRINITTVEK